MMIKMSGMSKIVLSLLSLYVSCRGVECVVAGIDFGSEYMKVAIAASGRPFEVILNESSLRKTVNAVSFAEKERTFGDSAASQASRAPSKVLLYSPTFLGALFDGIGEFKHPLPLLYYPYEIKHNETRGVPEIKVSEEISLTPEEMAATTLSINREMVNTSVGLPLDSVLRSVLSIPCDCKQKDRRAIVDAADLARTPPLGLIHTVAAAGTQHRLDMPITSQKTVMYIVFGSYFIDIGIMKHDYIPFKGKTTSKDIDSLHTPTATLLSCNTKRGNAGHFIDIQLAEYARLQYLQAKKVDLSSYPRALKKLLKQSKSVKHVLSANRKTDFFIENLHDGQDFHFSATREIMDNIVEKSNLKEHLQKLIQSTLDDATLTLENIQDIELLGGAWRMPKINQILTELLPNKTLSTHLNGDEAMVMGSTFLAANMSASFVVRKMEITDTSTCTYSLKLADALTPTENTKEIEEKEEHSAAIPFITKDVTLVAKGAKLGGAKSVTVKCMRDLYVELLEDGNVIEKISVSGITEAVSLDENVPLNPPKLALVFKIDNSGLFKLEKSSLIYQLANEEKDDKKRKFVPVKIENKSVLPFPPTTEEKTVSKTKLENLDQLDRNAKKIQETKNELEAYIYANRELAETQDFIDVMTPEQVEELKTKNAEAEEWLYDGAITAELPDINTYFDNLKNVVEPVRERAFEASQRDSVIALMEEELKLAHNRHEKFAARSYVPEADAKIVADFLEETRTWWETILAKQKALPKHEFPSFTAAHIREKVQEVNLKVDTLLVFKPPTTTTTTTSTTPAPPAATDATDATAAASTGDTPTAAAAPIDETTTDNTASTVAAKAEESDPTAAETAPQSNPVDSFDDTKETGAAAKPVAEKVPATADEL